MLRKSPLMSLKQMSDINLTPVMDLTFLLLITFIITYPLMDQGIPVNLPKGNARNLPEQKARTLTVNSENKVFLGEEQVPMDDLEARMRDIQAREPDVAIMVRADEGIRYGELVGVLKVLYRAGISKMALVTEAEETRKP